MSGVLIEGAYGNFMQTNYLAADSPAMDSRWPCRVA
jgi:hypothetical protein